MQHDRDGKPLECGDIVNLPCRITGMDRHENYINVALETIEPIHPAATKRNILVNAHQLVFVSHTLDKPLLQTAISSTDLDQKPATE